MRRPPRIPALVALLIAAFAAFTCILAGGDPCGDECGSSCGDCSACGQVAHLTRPDSPSPVGEMRAAARGVELRPTARPPRAVEHVPLATA